MFNYISDKLFDMKMDWIAADNKERAIKVVKAAADVAMLATGAGQVAKNCKNCK